MLGLAGRQNHHREVARHTGQVVELRIDLVAVLHTALVAGVHRIGLEVAALHTGLEVAALHTGPVVVVHHIVLEVVHHTGQTAEPHIGLGVGVHRTGPVGVRHTVLEVVGHSLAEGDNRPGEGIVDSALGVAVDEVDRILGAGGLKGISIHHKLPSDACRLPKDA
jgi:hypothetical protein